MNAPDLVVLGAVPLSWTNNTEDTAPLDIKLRLYRACEESPFPDMSLPWADGRDQRKRVQPAAWSAGLQQTERRGSIVGVLQACRESSNVAHATNVNPMDPTHLCMGCFSCEARFEPKGPAVRGGSA